MLNKINFKALKFLMPYNLLPIIFNYRITQYDNTTI